MVGGSRHVGETGMVVRVGRAENEADEKVAAGSDSVLYVFSDLTQSEIVVASAFVQARAGGRAAYRVRGAYRIRGAYAARARRIRGACARAPASRSPRIAPRTLAPTTPAYGTHPTLPHGPTLFPSRPLSLSPWPLPI